MPRSGCCTSVGFAEPGSTRRAATVEVYTWPAAVIDAATFAQVFADRQPDRFRDEPHEAAADAAFVILVERDGVPQHLLGLVAQVGDQVAFVQSVGIGLDIAPLEQVATEVLQQR